MALAAAIALPLAAGSTASAAGIVSWNKDVLGAIPSDGSSVAGVVPAAHWNNSLPTDNTIDLVDDDGNPTTIDIVPVRFNDYSIQGSDPGLDGDGTHNKRLLNGYLNAGSSAAQKVSLVAISEIPFARYDLVVYFSSDQPDRAGSVRIAGDKAFEFKTAGPGSIGGPNATFLEASATTTSTDAANYAVFTDLSGSSQTVLTDIPDFGGIAGFQVVDTSAAPFEGEEFWRFADRPTMGWNSWDIFGTTVTEAQTRAQADYMAENLLPHGWELITVDIQWYAPDPATAAGGDYYFYYTPNDQLVMDGYGRLQPAPARFPSATGGNGFTDLAAYVHSKGLKFGIHMMRGIPKQAVIDDLPILGTDDGTGSPYTAQDIADTGSICPWQWPIGDNYGVDMSKPGAQEYYDSLYSMYAEWGVDFVKIDDISRYDGGGRQAEIEAIRAAIDKVHQETGHHIAFSTSPGETPVGKGAHIGLHANQWRISDDFWDNWGALYDQFERLHHWTPFRGPGFFPDADMLPLGMIRASSSQPGGEPTNFTQDEQYTLMTLWSIARSPLIHGGDMTQTDAFTLELLTNDEVIAVNQRSTHNRQLFRSGDLVAWVADDTGSSDKYLAVFNTGASAANVPVDLADLGFSGSVAVRSLWDHTDLAPASGTFSPSVDSHGAGLYRLSGTVLPTPWLTDAVGADGEVTLTWEELPAADSFAVKRGTAETGPFTLVMDGLTGTSFTDATVSNGTTYHYVVSAMVSGEETPDSGALSAVPFGEAGTVSWNYDRYGTVNDDRVAGVVPVANWNNSWPSNPTIDLVDESGAPTTVDINYSSFNTYTVNEPGASNPGQDADGSYNRELLNGYLNAGNAEWEPSPSATSVTISEIPHGFYDIIVYFSSDVAGREGEVTDGTTTYSFNTVGPSSVSGVNAVLAETTDTTGTYATAANYATFRGLSGTSQTITVQMRDDDEWGGIAGFQIVPATDPIESASIRIVPEPGGTTAMLSWPAGLGEVVLEECADLASWVPSDPQPATNSMLVALDAVRRFYRLARP